MKFNCRNGLPHSYETMTDPETGEFCDFKTQVWEICVLCGDKVKWNKNPYTGRINNKGYLEAHIREFAQPYGRTGKVFEMLYGDPNKIDIKKKGTNANV
jgi:hypothetical protein